MLLRTFTNLSKLSITLQIDTIFHTWNDTARICSFEIWRSPRFIYTLSLTVPLHPRSKISNQNPDTGLSNNRKINPSDFSRTFLLYFIIKFCKNFTFYIVLICIHIFKIMKTVLTLLANCRRSHVTANITGRDQFSSFWAWNAFVKALSSVKDTSLHKQYIKNIQ